jgi:RNA polymerase sigma factor (sigma-70 family)
MDAAGEPAADHVARTVEAVWRMEAGQLIAALARVTGDVGTAEETAQEALATALEQWPRAGVPPNPAAWLMTTAKNRAIDAHRRRERFGARAPELGRELQARQDADSAEVDDRVDDVIGDDLLRLIFTACHPVLSAESRVGLTLRCLGGLTTDEIARAFLIPASTAAQRVVRAKKTLADRGVRFELPTLAEMAERLASVLGVIYLIFNEGYSATAGQDWMRPALCQEALRLGRILAARVPAEPEVHGLLALMELQASRLPARTGRDGEIVLLTDQDRRRWDRLLVRRGLEALRRAEALPGPIGPYTVQAGIAACHARAASVEDTDWARIAALYEVLRALWPSPVVELNRAVAVGMSAGPAEGLAIVDGLGGSGALQGYPHLAAVRADLLARLGRHAEAATQYQDAAELTRNDQERALFTARAEEQRSLLR